MQKYFTKEISQSLKVIVLGLAIGLGVSFVSANWTAPTSTAPACPTGQPGCDAPIDVSGSSQAKNGPALTGVPLFVHTLFGADNGIFLSGFQAGGPASLLGAGKFRVFGDVNIQRGSLNVITGGVNINRSAGTGSDGRNMFNLVGSDDNDSVGVIQNKASFFFWNSPANERASIQAKNADLASGQLIFNNENATDMSASDQIIVKGNPSKTDHNTLLTNIQKFLFWNSTTQAPATVVAKNVQLRDGTEGMDKVLVSGDNEGTSVWGTLTGATTIPTPDIIMVEEDWSGLEDSNSNDDNPLSCPADYAAIAVMCRSSAGGGVDDCYLTPDNGGNTIADVGQQYNWAASAEAGKYHAAVSSPSGNGNMHIVLTCMRYKNYPTIPITVTVNHPVVTTPTPPPVTPTWHFATSVDPTGGPCYTSVDHPVQNSSSVGYVIDKQTRPNQQSPWTSSITSITSVPLNQQGYCVSVPTNSHPNGYQSANSVPYAGNPTIGAWQLEWVGATGTSSTNTPNGLLVVSYREVYRTVVKY